MCYSLRRGRQDRVPLENVEQVGNVSETDGLKSWSKRRRPVALDEDVPYLTKDLRGRRWVQEKDQVEVDGITTG